MNILCSNVNNTGENVMIFTGEHKVKLEDAKAFFTSNGFTFDDFHTVPDKDLQYHIYDPLWLDADKARKINSIGGLKNEIDKTKDFLNKVIENPSQEVFKINLHHKCEISFMSGELLEKKRGYATRLPNGEFGFASKVSHSHGFDFYEARFIKTVIFFNEHV